MFFDHEFILNIFTINANDETCHYQFETHFNRYQFGATSILFESASEIWNEMISLFFRFGGRLAMILVAVKALAVFRWKKICMSNALFYFSVRSLSFFFVSINDLLHILTAIHPVHGAQVKSENPKSHSE